MANPKEAGSWGEACLTCLAGCNHNADCDYHPAVRRLKRVPKNCDAYYYSGNDFTSTTPSNTGSEPPTVITNSKRPRLSLAARIRISKRPTDDDDAN